MTTLIEETEAASQVASSQTSLQSRVRLRVGDIISHPEHGVGAVYATNWCTTLVAFVAADDAEFDTRELSKIALLLDKKLEYPRNFDNENWRQPLAETNLSYWHKTLAWGLVIGKYPRDSHPQFLADLKLKAKELQMLSGWNYPEGHPVWNSAAARESSEHFYNSNNRTDKATQGVLASRLEATARGGYVTRLIPDEIKYLPSGKGLRLFYVARISLLELNEPRVTKKHNSVCHHGIACPDTSCSLCLGILCPPPKKEPEPTNLEKWSERLFLHAVRFTQDRTIIPDEPMREIICQCAAIQKNEELEKNGVHLEQRKRPFCEYHVQLKRNRNGKKVRDESGNCVIDEKTGQVKKEFSKIIAEADARQEQLSATQSREERDRLAFAQSIQNCKPFDYFEGMSQWYWHGSLGIWKPYSMRIAASNKVELWYPKPTGKETGEAKKGQKWWPIHEPVYQKRDRNDFKYTFCPPSEIVNPFQEYQFIHLAQEDSLGKGCVNPESQRAKFNGRQVETNFIRQISKQQAVVQALYASILHKTEREGEAGLSRADIILRRKKQADAFFRIIAGASAFVYPHKYAYLNSQAVLESNPKTVEGYVRCFHGWLVIGQDEPELRGTDYCSVCYPVAVCEDHCKDFKRKLLQQPLYQVVWNPRNQWCSNHSETETACRRCGLGRIAKVPDIQFWNARLIEEARRVKIETGEKVELSELFESNLYPQWGLYGWR